MKSKDDAPARETPLTIEEALLKWQLIRDKALEFLLTTPTEEAKGTSAWCRVATDASAEIDRLTDRAAMRTDGGSVTVVFHGAREDGSDDL